MEIRQITESMSVAPQITAEDIPAIVAAGFKLVINNRPDGEVPGQPTNAEIEAAVRAAGLEFAFVPVTGGSMTPNAVAAHSQAMAAAEGPVLAYCRSGNRSCHMWALAEAGKQPAAVLLATAANAGYDISGIRPILEVQNR